MRALAMVGGALVWCLCAPPAFSQTAKQPPMNDFNSAFYTCAQGAAFEVSYDSTTPTEATVTTNLNNTQYVLKRTQGEAQFAKGAVRFEPVGRTAVVEGTKAPLKDCKLKGK